MPFHNDLSDSAHDFLRVVWPATKDWFGGAYQWEALDDATAGELIVSAVAQYVNDDVIEQVQAEAEHTAEQVREHLSRFELGAAS